MVQHNEWNTSEAIRGLGMMSKRVGVDAESSEDGPVVDSEAKRGAGCPQQGMRMQGPRPFADSSPATDRLEFLSEDLNTSCSHALRKAGAWYPPPNWSQCDWKRELIAVIEASACSAENDYDSSFGVPKCVFVFQRAVARALTRYRQEWRYALRFPSVIDADDSDEGGDYGDSLPSGADQEALEKAIVQLAESDRWLLVQLYWQRRTEASVANELAVSQPTIHKRKQKTLQNLRALLSPAL